MSESRQLRELQSLAGTPNIYNQGRMLAEQRPVTRYEVRQIDGVVEIEGVVHDAYGLEEPFLAYDLAQKTFITHCCTCESSLDYDGMCAHEVALALVYLDSKGEALDVDVVRPDERANPWTLAPATTSPQIERAVHAYAEQVVRATKALATSSAHASDLPPEPADLTCIVSSGSDSGYSYREDYWSLGLRITVGKAGYIIKNVDQLVKAWSEGTHQAYGKRIAFTHLRSAFTDRANSLLELLESITNAQASLEASQLHRYNSSFGFNRMPSRPTKVVPLSPAQLIQVLDLMQDTEVLLEDYEDIRYSYAKVKHPLLVCEGTPRIDVRIRKGRNNGYDLLMRPHELYSVSDGTTLYLLGNDRAIRCEESFARDLGAFCEAVLPHSEALHVRAEDMPSFCASVLPVLRRHTSFEAPDDVLDFVPPPAELSFRIGMDRGRVSCEALVTYGGERVGLFETSYDAHPVRDVAAEVIAQQLVRRYFPLGDSPTPDYSGTARRPVYYSWQRMPQPEDPWFPEADDDAYFLLLSDGLRELSQVGDVLLSDRLRNAGVRQAPQVRVEAGVRGGLLNLRVTTTDMDPAELAAYLASYHRKQRYVRLDGGDVVRLDGSVQAIGDLADGLGLDVDQLVAGASELPLNRTLFVDAMLKRAPGVRFERNRSFRGIVRDFETVADADYTPPEQLRDVLRPYQEEGFKWLCTLGAVGFCGILADDMGLGKTVQAIAYLQHARDGGEDLPALVVCPASLVYNWQAEFARFAPSMRVTPVVGAKRARTSILEQDEADVLVTSYDLLRRDVDAYHGRSFSCVILDEAQFVKNHNTKAAKAVRELDARVRFALTGTPIENRLLELWSIFDFLMPGVLGGAKTFSQRFANPIAAGDEAASRKLRGLVAPFILRRLKRDVASDLPEKNESVVLANMEGEQDKLYRASASRLALMLSEQTPQEFAGQKLKVLAELTKLRQLCCDPHLLYDNYEGGSAKLDTTMELVRQAVEGGHQLLLFSQFTSMLQILQERLDAERIGWLKLTGSTSKEARKQLVERFQAGEAPVFLISLKAGGTGLNLTAADIVIHYDPWWNLAAQNQATDRTHRIGQNKEVSVFKLIAKDTIEERIVELQEAKRDLAEQVIGGDAVSSASLTQEDLLALLGATE